MLQSERAWGAVHRHGLYSRGRQHALNLSVCELYTLCDVYREVLPWRVELDGTSCAVSLD